MKNCMVLIVILLLMLASGVAGYFMNKSRTVIYPQPVPVFREDTVLLYRIDSLNTVNKVHVYIIDSLKRENIKLKQKHEKDITDIDTLPAPLLYRKIAEYYSRKQ